MTWRSLGPLYRLMVALQFLTRFPMPRTLNPTSKDLGLAASYFPVVGVCVGGVLALASLALAHTPWPSPVHIALLLVLGVLCTGAFHEDGLADSFDGLWGGWTREDVLRIMRDSRIGTYGACALLGLFTLRFGALSATERAWWPCAFIVAHTLGRTSTLPLIVLLPYARAEREGVAKTLVEGLDWGRMCLGLFFAALICRFALGSGVLAIQAMLGAGLVSALCAAYVVRRIGGITGDVLGAINVVVEVSVLLAFAWMCPS